MKKKTTIWICQFILTGLLSILFSNCKKDISLSITEQIPIITTSVLNGISNTTVNCGGNITSDGGSMIITRGVCWSTGLTPTISDNKTNDGTGVGSFASAISGLTPNTTYYVRSYATNNTGTGYGSILSFTTMASLSQLVAGNYSGNGKYMPHLQSLGPNTFECSVPDWAALLKTGLASASVSTIDDSTINIALSGSIYSTGFNRNLKLIKNGNQIFDPTGILKFYIDTKSLQIAFKEIVIATGGGCNSVNGYYYVFEGAISVPPYPRYSYTSIGNWEFNGTK